ncbi:MAG: hypothetical protein A4E56_02650 [Pelotomaculum sp. PtaU1.Bin065]|nr:MAG: hypothetical protein A4E56_02650 [Pelotomaculum sp. PtaU1.Bin065]
MTIALVVSTPQGIILASESRAINGSPEWYANFEKGIYSNDFKVLEGEHPKIHKIGRHCLIYSGVSHLTYSGLGLTGVWTSDQEIANLQRMAAEGCSFKTLAESFYTRLSTILNGHGFGFLLCGYDCGGFQVWAEGSSDEPFSINGGPGSRPIYRMQAFGTVDVIRKLISDEVIKCEAMSLQEALTFTLLTISVGCKYLKWFNRLPAVSGGNIYVAVVTPGGIRGFKFPEYNPAVPGGALPWHMPDVAGATRQNESVALGIGARVREVGGNIYASTFRTSAQDADTYITLTPQGTLESYYQGKQNLGMWAGQNWGNLVFFYDGDQVGQLYTTSDYDPVLGGTTKKLVVWSKSDGSLRLQGPGIELDSDCVNLAGNSSAHVTVRGRFDDNLLPYVSGSGWIGNDTYKWYGGNIQHLTHGDLCFIERTCPICEQPFKTGDAVVLLVRCIHEVHGTMTIPVHDRCKNVKKPLEVDVPEVEQVYRLRDDGELEAHPVVKFKEMEESVCRLKEGYTLDEATGQFKKKALTEQVIKEGYSAKKTDQGIKYYNSQTGHEVEPSSIMETVEVSPERPATKEEAVKIMRVKRKRPVMKTITIELNAPAEAEPVETADSVIQDTGKYKAGV